MNDAIVVGAGPAGLYTALRAAEGGLSVVVLEEHEELGVPTHCSGIVSGETNRLYKVPDDVVLSRPVSCLVISPGRPVAGPREPGGVTTHRSEEHTFALQSPAYLGSRLPLGK